MHTATLGDKYDGRRQVTADIQICARKMAACGSRPVPHTVVHANATSHGRLFTDPRTVSGCGEAYGTLNSGLIQSDTDLADNGSSEHVRLYKGVGLYSQNQPDKNRRSLG